MAGILGDVDATGRVDCIGVAGPQLASAPGSSTWGSSMQLLGGTWCPVSEGSHPRCFLRSLAGQAAVGGVLRAREGPRPSGLCTQWQALPPVVVRPLPALWGLGGLCESREKSAGKAGPAGRREGVLATSRAPALTQGVRARGLPLSRSSAGAGPPRRLLC